MPKFLTNQESVRARLGGDAKYLTRVEPIKKEEPKPQVVVKPDPSVNADIASIKAVMVAQQRRISELTAQLEEKKETAIEAISISVSERDRDDRVSKAVIRCGSETWIATVDRSKGTRFYFHKER